MKPNFFIVGAPKCGTTALAQYLAEHPRIFISPVKEPHYFSDDLPRYRHVKNEGDYLALFDEAEAKHLCVGEASVFYLFSEVAIKRIKAFDSESRLIVMLRNPVEMVQSLHSQLLYSRDEIVENFSEAWALASARRIGVNVPRSCRDVKLLGYDRVARYGEQLERLYSEFSRENVLVIFYEDFAADLPRVYAEVLWFLGLPGDGRQDFPVINANKSHKRAMLGQFTQKTPRSLVRAAMLLKRAIGIKKWGVLDGLRAMNRSDQRRTPLVEGLRHEIIECYRDDVVRLSTLTGRDLNAWIK